MENNEYIYCTNLSNKELKEQLENARELGYTYIVRAEDKFLSGWGQAENKKHIQLRLARDNNELDLILTDLRKKDSGLSRVNYNYVSNKDYIINTIKGKSWTLRNDWTRAFEKEEYIK